MPPAVQNPLRLAAPVDAGGDEEGPPRYEVTDSGIVRLVPDKNGQLRDVPLANFDARIVRAVVIDDGEEERTFFDVDIVVKNRTYPQRNLQASDFESLAWLVPATRGRGIIEPTRGTREVLRHAIQILSGEYQIETRYGHLGWRLVANDWVYLHAGGAIGATGLVPDAKVSLSEALAGFHLPDPEFAGANFTTQSARRSGCSMPRRCGSLRRYSVRSGAPRSMRAVSQSTWSGRLALGRA